MKNENTPRGFLRNLGLVLVLLGAAYFITGQLSALSGIGHLRTAGHVASVGPTTPAKFDGHVLYQRSFEALRDYHKELADPAKRAAFEQEWEHKFDKTGDLDTEAGADAAVAKMMESLGQRFDYYFGVDATEAENNEVSSTLVGIGITIHLADQESLFKGLPDQATRADVDELLRISKGHEFTVDDAIEGGPSVGKLKAGDVITHIDGKPIDGMKMSDAVKAIRGEEGTSVRLEIDRVENGVKSTLTLNVTREKVKLKVVHTKDLGDGVTYVKVDNFMSRTTASEFAHALDGAVKAKTKGIVIDLRGNPGGELNTVLSMAAMIIPDGTILVTEARDAGGDMGKNQVIVNRDFITTVNDDKVSVGPRPPLLVPENMPIVVLVNNGSASASEILSGALQAHHRATIVGKPSHGKGVGQTVIDLPFGRRMHVTNFEFLPGGVRMDWVGVIPEVEVDADKSGKDVQLDTAVATLKKKMVDADVAAKRADELQKKNHSDFDKERQLRDQKRSENLRKQ